MFPRLASASRPKATMLVIVALTFICDGVEDRLYDNNRPSCHDPAAGLEVYMEFLYVSAVCEDKGSYFEVASHRVRRTCFRDEVEDRLHNDLSAPRPDPSWGA